MKNILITGSNGQLGHEISQVAKNYPQFNFIFTDVEELDITNKNEVESLFENKNIDCVINCAAFTAVDKAEDSYEKATELNAKAPGILAEVTKNNNAKIVQISTDFVFDGNNNIPYKEDELPNPASAYGKTKFAGEKEIINATKDYIIIRTAWLYSSHGHNFVKSMRKYANERGVLNVVFDQVGTPTYAYDLAEVILKLIDKNARGIFHFTNEGVASWFDFAKAIVDISAIDCEVNPLHTEEFPLPAQRPQFSVLDKTKIKKTLSIKIPYWRDSLVECINKLK
ncbi:MAG: dTDP-4-dehydrorhamnose reductase [Bacteroidota bacterium]|nr:dTDP-4-dehydrorhamnose reductase [Bacteroidota bacterium]